MAAPPGCGSFLVTTERRQVEDVVGAHQRLDSTGVGGVGVVHDPILESEGAQPLSLRRGLVDVPEVVFGAGPLLLLREGRAEVVLEVAAEGGDPGERQPMRSLYACSSSSGAIDSATSVTS